MSPPRQVFARFVGEAKAVEIDIALRNDGQVVINTEHLDALLAIVRAAQNYLYGNITRDALVTALEPLVPVRVNRVGPHTDIGEYLKRSV